MNSRIKIEILTRYMMSSMTSDEKEFLLFYHLCSHLEEDHELFQVNWSLMKEDIEYLKGETSHDESPDMANMQTEEEEMLIEDIFPAVYERLRKNS